MLRRTHVEPFLEERAGRLHVELLEDRDGRVTAFLDRLLRLLRRLEGRDRRTVLEALRRQERRVRDARRLDGIAKTLLDACRFEAPPGAERAPEVRDVLFEIRGQRWPPIPGDALEPYRVAGERLDLPQEEVRRLLYADHPDRLVLRRVPGFGGNDLLVRYNRNLAAGVLLEAERVVITARGGWGPLLRTVKLARLMYRLERAGRRTYRLELTGPATRFITRERRYGSRFVRVVPVALRAPAGRLEALVVHDGHRLEYTLERTPALAEARRPRATRYDSGWEASLAREFATKLGEEREGWSIQREGTPVPVGEELFLPDFTFRHRDGREALVEIVGFWTAEYLESKLRKVRAAGLDNLVLVAYRGLLSGEPEGAGASTASGRVLEFARKPLIGEVMEAVERVARAAGPP